MNQPTLFPLPGESRKTTPKTEGIKYAGSKLKLLPHILDAISEFPIKRVLDGFAGTTRVSQALARRDYEVVANDVSAWSWVFGNCYLKNQYQPEHYQRWIKHLNQLPGKDGWFTQNYGGHAKTESAIQEDGTKKPWQIHNTRKLDAIRDEIENLTDDPVQKSVLLASLILALDKVDSTLGHHVSYLKEWAPRSYKTLSLEVPAIFTSSPNHEVLRGDIFDAVKQAKVDLAYFDPPYGSNNDKMPPSRVRYASYYHIWTSIIENDRPKLVGKASRREDCSDLVAGSIFEEFRRSDSGRFIAMEALERLIASTKSRFILLSYSSGGRATAEELMTTLESRGRVARVIEVDYKQNIMASMRWTHDWVRDAEKAHREFLFLLEQ
ncbi:MAG TPA: DNA methyltransferase [Planctomycetaceae bacterium]|jgi:adenine-specific DNA-methyltransferase|nr:DNA methyltransferase [Planctomycetaceae bacterium]